MQSRTRIRAAAWTGLAILAVMGHSIARADHFTYVDEEGSEVRIEARLVASGQGVHLLELADGQYRIVPQGAVMKRELSDGPTPLTEEQMAATLEQRFGADHFRSYIQKPFVMGLVLGSPLPKSSELRASSLMKKGARFMTSVAAAFVDFVGDAQIKITPPRHPLVVLIFETDADFEAYAEEATGGGSLSASRISGFYSGLTNFLAIRLSECNTFDVPLHEAIHQQVYNRNVFQRFAPVPHWFDEGIATGFEANNGRITVSPVKISPRYAQQALASDNFDWKTMAANDKVFMGDVLAGEAYGQAWGLHWLLVTKYRDQYRAYVRILSAKQPLEVDSIEQRQKDFETAIQKSIDELEAEFPTYLSASAKRQRIGLTAPKPPGISVTTDNLARVELSAVSLVDVGQLKVEGKLVNLSPLRSMSFHVTVETDAGTYADWWIDDLGISRTAPLPSQFVTKAMRNGGLPGQSRTFRVRVRSTTPDSPEAERWRKGELPIPSFGG